MKFKFIKNKNIEDEEYLNTDSLKGLQVNIKNVKSLFAKSNDCIFRQIVVNSKVTIHLVFIDGLINQSYLSEYVLKPLTSDFRFIDIKNEKELINEIKEGAIYYPTIEVSDDLRDIVEKVLMGSAVFIFDNKNTAVLFDTKGFEQRGMTEPTEETSLKGSKDSFVETIRVNTALIRRRIRTPNLIIEDITVGNVSNTIVSLVYLDGIVGEELVAKCRERIECIETDQVLFTNVIEENIIDNKHTLFPQVEYTEKPDKFCAALFEGRVGIIIDGIPFVMIIPTSIVNFFQTTDDYTHNYIVTSVIRILRYFMTIAALFLPAFYVAVTGFHHEMIPEALALSIIQSEKGVPFPIFLECIVMVIAFEVLIEAGARIWSSIGGMVSLVGALIVGEAAIKAGYISPGVVVVVATAAISNYTIPNKDFSYGVWIWSLILIMLSSMIGLFGLVIGAILLLYHLCQIEVLEVPYLAPFVSNDGKNTFDSVIRSLFVFEKKKTIRKKDRSN